MYDQMRRFTNYISGEHTQEPVEFSMKPGGMTFTVIYIDFIVELVGNDMMTVPLNAHLLSCIEVNPVLFAIFHFMKPTIQYFGDFSSQQFVLI